MDWHKFSQIARFVAPLVLPVLGVPPGVTNLVVNGISVAEAAGSAGGKSGAEKKQIAMDAVVTGLNAVNVAHPGTVDVPQVMEAVSDGIDATVKAVNAAQNIPVHNP